jgi:hypothetical protein
MSDDGLREAKRDQARRHHLRFSILALVTQGRALDPEDLRRALPTHPEIPVIEYHLLVLRNAGLLPSDGPGSFS